MNKICFIFLKIIYNVRRNFVGNLSVKISLENCPSEFRQKIYPSEFRRNSVRRSFVGISSVGLSSVRLLSEICPSDFVGNSSEILTKFRRNFYFRRIITDDYFRPKFIGNGLFRQISDEIVRRKLAVFL